MDLHKDKGMFAYILLILPPTIHPTSRVCKKSMVDQDNTQDLSWGKNPVQLYMVAIRHQGVLLTGIALLGYKLYGVLIGR